MHTFSAIYLLPKGSCFCDWSLWAPRGELGGIFVKIPPKTSKNALLEILALLVRSVLWILGNLVFLGAFWLDPFAYMPVQKGRLSGGCETRAGG